MTLNNSIKFGLFAATRDSEDVLVTATRAIFTKENNYRLAPAAVVGVTIKHSKFVEYFKNETYKVSYVFTKIYVRKGMFIFAHIYYTSLHSNTSRHSHVHKCTYCTCTIYTDSCTTTSQGYVYSRLDFPCTLVFVLKIIF